MKVNLEILSGPTDGDIDFLAAETKTGRAFVAGAQQKWGCERSFPTDNAARSGIFSA